MPRDYSEVVYSVVEHRIAPLNILTGVYGTAREFAEVQSFDFKPVADNDQIMSKGRLKHLLSVITSVEFTMSGAGIDWESLTILVGSSTASDGTTPNRTKKKKVAAGGAGLPYFGQVIKLVGEQGDDLHIGLPICKLDTMPGWTTEQNKYVLPESGGKAIADDDDFAIYLLGNETAAEIDFNEIFA